MIQTRATFLPLALLGAVFPLAPPPSFAGDTTTMKPWSVEPQVKVTEQLFAPEDVRLLDGPFRTMQDVDHAYLIRLEPDRLLSLFRSEAGLEPKAIPYGGWESVAAPGTIRSLAGHSLGHYLSAISWMYRATGDEQLRDRVAYIAKEWKECQDKRGDGSLVAFPYARELEAAIRSGKVETIDNYWAPFYTIHKQLAGLRDAWIYCGDETAKEVMIRLSEWCGSLVRDLPDERRERMLRSEHGGMAEVLADAYAITGDERFLQYARLYSHHELLDPLANGKDELNGKHANTQIPKVIGFQRIHQLSGDPAYGSAAKFFWETVVENRTWANGGNSIHEHFPSPDHMNEAITHDGGPETCNTYNMLRLTAFLHQEKPDPAHLDYYENALFNHILTSQAPLPGAGAFVYYTPLRPDYARSYGTAFNSFWCCTGTGMENHARYGELIYTHNDDALSVNLFMASTLDWKERGLSIRQETRFPDEPSSTLVITEAPAEKLTIRIRKPSWLNASGINAQINNKPANVAESNGFVEINRRWMPGDRIRFDLPMKLRVVRQPQCPTWMSVFYGPMLLAGELGSEGFTQKDYIGLYTPIRSMRPLEEAPVFIAENDAELLSRIHPVPGKPLTFRTEGLARPQDALLAPLYRIHFQRYAIYWQMTDAARAEENKRKLAETEKLERQLDARTIDRVRLGEQQPETDHNLLFESSRTGMGPQGKHFRSAEKGGWFSFELKAPPKGSMASLRLLFRSKDNGPEFDLLVDSTIIASAKPVRGGKGEYNGMEYPIPNTLLENKAKITVRIQAKPDKTTPPVYDLRVVTTS